MDGAGELGVVLFGDVVVDGDADGAGEVGVGVVVGLGEGDEGGGGALPLVGCEVGDGALEDFEARDDGECEEEACSGGGEGDGCRGVFGDVAPEEGAEGHASLEGHEVGA